MRITPIPLMSKLSPCVVLAIAPGTRHLGFALMEGKEVIRYGVKAFPGRKSPRKLWTTARRFLEKLLRSYRPRVLVVQDVYYAQRRLCPQLRELTARMKRGGKGRGLRTRRFLPIKVKERLCPAMPTRRSLAQAIVRRHRFLSFYLKSKERPPYWLQMFDAVALGAVTVEGTTRAKLSGHPRKSRVC